MRNQSFTKNCYYMLYLFMLGLFIGILIVNVGHDTWIKDGELLGNDMLEKLESSTLESGKLFGYILKHRLFTLCMLGLLATTMFGAAVICGYICYMGFTAGCLLSVAVIRYGIRGMILMMAGIFPQGILLIPAYVALFLWAAGINRVLYSKGTYMDSFERYSKQFYLKKGIQIMGIIVVVIMGCLLESYVNPKMLHLVLNIF
ncbi:MAG: stage II sporulation protein M [Lachnospiraceae bacterium]|nr:stage II sporulation protein M [Lachnospiraceae bacterium]